ncbi:hypothetical protein FAUST_11550, partial [Fusarium austroamericanum]
MVTDSEYDNQFGKPPVPYSQHPFGTQTATSTTSKSRKIYCPRDEAGRKIASTLVLPSGRPSQHRSTRGPDEKNYTETKTLYGLAAMISKHGPGKIRVIYAAKTLASWPDQSGFCWIQSRMTYPGFKTKVKEQLRGNTKANTLVSQLLSEIEETKIAPFPYGEFVDPGTVLRLDGTLPIMNSLASGIFTCLPYLDVGCEDAGQTPSPSARAFPSRGLLQTLYPFEAVKDREKEQVIRRLGDKEPKIIRVSQLWALSLRNEHLKDLLITYGTMAMDSLYGDSLCVEPIWPGKLTTMLLRFTDESGQSLQFEIPEFQTFLEVEAAILRRFRDIQSTNWDGDCDVYSKLPSKTRRETVNSILSTSVGLMTIRVTDSSGDQPGHPRAEGGMSILKAEVDLQFKPTARNEDSEVKKSTVPPFFSWPTSTDPSRKRRKPSRYLKFATTILRKPPSLDSSVDKNLPSEFNFENQARSRPVILKTKAEADDLIRSIPVGALVVKKTPTSGRDIVAEIMQKRKTGIRRSLERCRYAITEILDSFVSAPTEAEEPDSPLSTCWTSLHNIATSPDRLIQHLKRKHFLPQPNQAPVHPTSDDIDFLPWIHNTNRWVSEETLRCLALLLVIATGFLERLHQDVLHIKDGVRKKDGSKHDKYLLHQTLLLAFVQIIRFVDYLQTAAKAIKSRINNQYSASQCKNLKDLAYVFQAVTKLGQSALKETKNARLELYNMVREVGGSKLHESLVYGPNVVLGSIAHQLFQRSVLENKKASSIYSEAFDRIEELSALSQVNKRQRRAVIKWRMVCDDDTYHSSDPHRKHENQYQQFLAKRTIAWLEVENRDYTEMIELCRPLIEQVKQNIEINEEDHGKAIFAFTFVTVIFLPLSFITSYFGMNTADIRDTPAKQDLFWAIALPVTAAVVVVTVALAYWGETVYDLVTRVLRKTNTGETLDGRVTAPQRRHQSAGDDQTYIKGSSEVVARSRVSGPIDPIAQVFRGEDDTVVVMEAPDFRAWKLREASQAKHKPLLIDSATMGTALQEKERGGREQSDILMLSVDERTRT